MQRDIRKWFMKAHDKGNEDAAKPEKQPPPAGESKPETPVQANPRRKTSKYFDKDKQKPKDVKEIEELPAKRKAQSNDDQAVKVPPSKKAHKDDDNDDDDDFVMPDKKKSSVDATPSKKLKSGSGRGVAQKAVDNDAGEEDDKDTESPLKSAGRGRGGRGGASASSGGRGRGGGRGGFMNFGERKDPPHKGEKEVPEGSPDCLAGLTFVISGTLDSLEREEAEDLIKRHGGRVTGSISKKTNYLLCDEDIGGRKSSKAKELGTKFLSEDGLFDMIRSSNKNIQVKKEEKEPVHAVTSPAKKTPQRAESKSPSKSSTTNMSQKISTTSAPPAQKKEQSAKPSILPWTEKYRPKAPNDIVGNQSLVNQLHTWLKSWNQQFLNSGNKGKGKKPTDSSAKKAVLLSGTPGIGKTSAAKVVCQMLGFQAIEVNASDNRGKAIAKINKGIDGSNVNSVKESIDNETIFTSLKRVKTPKSVLIMDEVDGMTAGDRGGIADLIDSIKKSKIPIICICNDRYSQKLKSLLNYCLLLSFRKPTKQQMAKRLMQIATVEGLKANEIALEELAERVNGDMRMALNQLQYMSLSMSSINYDDIRQRLASSRKDEDISPFTAVDKLFNFNGGRLRMDERLDLGMSDLDLIPLIIQENYINYRPSSIAKDDNGMKRMNLLARAADSISDGDIINVQIRRYQQWQLAPSSCVASAIIPAALMHGSRETLEPGERNFNRFGGWLGKNSTMGKNYRLLEDLHLHLLASRGSNLSREALRLDYNTLLMKQLTDPLRLLPKDEAVEKVVEFMNTYSISQEDTDTILELSKFQGHPNPMEGIPSAVKAALTRAYKGSSRMIKSADLVPLPGVKKAPTKRIAAMLEPVDVGLPEENDDAMLEKSDDENSDSEDTEGAGDADKLQSELDSLKSKGMKVEMELKSNGTKTTARGRGKTGSASVEKKPAGRGRGRGESSGSKRKR